MFDGVEIWETCRCRHCRGVEHALQTHADVANQMASGVTKSGTRVRVRPQCSARAWAMSSASSSSRDLVLDHLGNVR